MTFKSSTKLEPEIPDFFYIFIKKTIGFPTIRCKKRMSNHKWIRIYICRLLETKPSQPNIIESHTAFFKEVILSCQEKVRSITFSYCSNLLVGLLWSFWSWVGNQFVYNIDSQIGVPFTDRSLNRQRLTDDDVMSGSNTVVSFQFSLRPQKVHFIYIIDR